MAYIRETVRRGEIDNYAPDPEAAENSLGLGEDGVVRQAVAPPPTEEAWRVRANEYNVRYRGPELWVRFLRVLAATGSFEFAIHQSGISRGILRRKRERFPLFDKAVIEAHDYFKGAILERAAVTRAIDGWNEPVYHQGVLVGYVRKFSDKLLSQLLDGQMPERYRKEAKGDTVNNTMNITIVGGLPKRGAQPLALEHEALDELPAPTE